MIRIKYQTGEKFIHSQEIFCVTEMICVAINKENFNFILKSTKCIIFRSEPNKDMATAKRLAKLKLKELGAVFQDEVRGKDKVI